MTDLYALETGGVGADVVGPGSGLTPADLDAALPRAERAQRALFEAREAGRAGFLDLPLHRDHLEACRRAAEPLRGRCENLVVLGMGGSALGPRALISALAHPWQQVLSMAHRDGHPRVLVVDTADPASLVPLLDALPPETTWWNLVSKSGGTIETLAGWGLLRPHLERQLGGAWRDKVVVTTDPQQGALRREADRERLACLGIPPDVGGRFSVLSAVGLFPAVVAGIDGDALLRGAADAAHGFESADPRRNDALRLALLMVLLAERHGRTTHVMLPYRQGLWNTSLWWQQLWAESLGKQGRGFEAVAALGSASQHSLLQLWMEGPDNRAFLVIEVDDPGVDRVIDPPGPPGMGWLARRTLGDAQAALAAGTRAALAERGRPVLGLRLPALRAEHLGALLQLLMTATALAGHLIDVDPYDQPGVAEGKANARARLGDPDERERRGRVDALLERLRTRR